MNRELMARQMFANGGVAKMEEGGEPSAYELSPEEIRLLKDQLYDMESGRVLESDRQKLFDVLEKLKGRERLEDRVRRFLESVPVYPKNTGDYVESQTPSENYRDMAPGRPFITPQERMPIIPAAPFLTPREQGNPEDMIRLLRMQEQINAYPGRMSQQEMQTIKDRNYAYGGPVYKMQEGGVPPVNPMAGMPVSPDAAMPPMAGAAGVDPAMMEQMLMQAQQNITALDDAESAEEVMNAMRGDQATIEERRMELAQIVGEGDAQSTPESVLTLVQPVMMMAQVDQGIGGLAQEQMNQPVTGDMAGGIMSTVDMGAEEGPAPVNFKYGGAVQYFAPENANRVAGITDNTLLAEQLGMTQQQYEEAVRQAEARPGDLFRQQQNILRGIFDTDAEKAAAAEKAKKRTEMTQAQALFDVAEFGLNLASRAPYQMSLAEKLAYAAKESKLFPKIGERSALLAEQKAADEARIKEQQRALDLAAYNTASQLYGQEVKDVRDLYGESLKQAYTTENKRVEALKDLYTKNLELEAKSEMEIARDKRQANQRLREMVAEANIKPETGEYVTDDGRLKIVYEIHTKSINEDTGVADTEVRVRNLNGKPIITAINNDYDIKEFDDGNGNKVAYQRRKNSTDDWEPILINGVAAKTESAKFEWKERKLADGTTAMELINTNTGDAKNSYVVPNDLELREVSDGGVTKVIGIDKQTGDVQIVFSGAPENKQFIIDGSLININPVTGKTNVAYTSPGKPELRQGSDGRWGYISPPTPSNPNGEWVPVHGSVPNAKKYSYENWIDPETSEILTLFRVDDGKELYYGGLVDENGRALQVNPSELTRLTNISKDTAYNAAIDLAEGKAAREEYLEALMGQFGAQLEEDNLEKYVNEVHGPLLSKMDSEKRESYREEMIDRLEFIRDNYNEYRNLAKDIQDGTGFFNKLKVGAGTLFSIAGGNLNIIKTLKRSVEANQAVRAISLNLRMAAANSPRFAEGEQNRLRSIMVDADKWFTSGEIELSKARVLKQQIQSELTYVTRMLSEKRRGLSAPVKTALEQSKVALDQALRVMQVIVPYGQEVTQRSTQLKEQIKSLKEQEANKR